MWPWEHAIVGYLAYSLFVHVVFRRSPTGGEAVTVVFASVLPDLVDKPLAWEFGVFPSGYGIAHSIFFAVPLAVVAVLVSASARRPDLGAAFAIGYLLHLPADVLPHSVSDGSLPVERLLWPIETVETPYPDGFAGTFAAYFRDYRAEMLSADPSGYALAVTGAMVLCLLLWLYDGMPGVREPIAFLRRRFSGPVA